MTHVRVPRWVRKHLEAVILRPRRVLGDLERACGGPHLLPFPLQLLGLVLRHNTDRTLYFTGGLRLLSASSVSSVINYSFQKGRSARVVPLADARPREEATPLSGHVAGPIGPASVSTTAPRDAASA